MLDLKMNDVSLRIMPFTLGPAAEEFGVEKVEAGRLLKAMHYNLREETEENPNFPNIMTVEDILSTGKDSLEHFLQNGLISVKSDEIEITQKTPVEITQKTVEIFNRAAERQKTLNEMGFSFCGCLVDIM